MNRTDIILEHIDKHGCGIEIGPSYNPAAPKKDGFKVHIIDHMSRDALREKYKNLGKKCDHIEEVDFVWSGETYAALTGKSKHYDWIIASHVIEHTPDLIGFLLDCDAILKNEGVISLVIPDKRYCFDHFRPITSISKVVDSHFQGRKVHSPGTIIESCLNAVSRGGHIAWHAREKGTYSFLHSFDDAVHAARSQSDERAYLDMHAWCFTPHAFRLMMHDLFRLDLIPFKEVSFCPTRGGEFFVTLGRKGQGIGKPRIEMLDMVEQEMIGHTSKWGRLLHDVSQRVEAIAHYLVERLRNQ